MGEITNKYLQLKEDRLNGIYHGAPLFKAFPRFGSVFPVIMRAKQMGIMGGPGAGKTNFWMGFILLPIYDLIKNGEYKAFFHIYFLEDDLEFFQDRLMTAVLYRYFGINTEVLELYSMKEEIIPPEVEAKLSEAELVVEDILSHCRVVDTIYNASGIYKDARTESGKFGEHVWEDRVFDYKKEDGSTYNQTVKVYKEYIPDDPKLHHIMIIDNLNNLKPEKGGSRHDAIGLMCRDYNRLQITKHWKWTVIPIQQSALESDKKQFDMMRGEQIIEKVEPTISDLGNNKEILRDLHSLIAIFAPHRYGISDYEGHNISRLKDKYRAAIVLKSNFSQANFKIPLLFLGNASYYKEFPKPEDMTEAIYKKLE